MNGANIGMLRQSQADQERAMILNDDSLSKMTGV